MQAYRNNDLIKALKYNQVRENNLHKLKAKSYLQIQKH